MATKKLLGTLANYGWKSGVHKNAQYGEHSPARKAAGLGPDPLTQWCFFAVTGSETYGCDTKQEAEAIFKTMKESVQPKTFTEWLTEDTARLSVRPHTKVRSVGGDVDGFLITGRNNIGGKVKVFVRKRSTADAAIAAIKAGKPVDTSIFKLDEEDVTEDAAANCAGGGAIAGLGVGPKGEPGVNLKKKRKDEYSLDDMLHEDDESEDRLAARNKMSARDVDDELDEGYNELSSHYIARLRHLQTELGRVRFGLSRNPKSRKLKKEEGSHLRRITREFNRLVKISEAVDDKVEAAYDSAFGNEWDTVIRMAKYKNETPESKDGIARVRAFRMAAYYADEFGVSADDLKTRICGGTKGSRDWQYFEKESSKKLYEEVQSSGTFAGADVFDVTTEKFMTSRFGKNRYHRYSRYVGEDETGEAIRKHGRSTKRDIILKDGTTGAMVYLRRKRPV